MKNKYWPIIGSLLLCSTLSNVYAADDYVDTYTPGTSSKMGLFKTVLIGVGLMSMPKPVGATFYPGFKNCYKGTIDPTKSISTNTLAINTIGYSPCSYGQLHPIASDFNLKNIDMKLTVIPTYGDDTRVGITNIEFTGWNFSTAYSAKIDWKPIDPSLPNPQFFLNIYDDKICFPISLGQYANTQCQSDSLMSILINGNSKYIGKGNDLFYANFSAFMKK